MKPIIFFVHSQKSYLPEIFAYTKYCEMNNIDYKLVDSSFNFESIDFPHIKWTFMGKDTKRNKNSFIVHEYLSLSIGRFKQIKNIIKKSISIKPDVQIFLNETIKNNFHIKETPYTIRDMGIDDSFFNCIQPKIKKYDFCYCGSMDKSREINKLLDLFVDGILKNHTIVLLGTPPDELSSSYKYENISFYGKVNYTEVPEVLLTAKCAINYIPNKYPFNIQTPTKFLEYLALGLPIISTQYLWVEEFLKEKSIACHYLNELPNLDINKFISSEHKQPNMSEFKWSNIIHKSKVFDIVTHGFYKKYYSEHIPHE